MSQGDQREVGSNLGTRNIDSWMLLAEVGARAKAGHPSATQESECRLALAVSGKATRGELADAVAMDQYRQKDLWMANGKTPTGSRS